MYNARRTFRIKDFVDKRTRAGLDNSKIYITVAEDELRIDDQRHAKVEGGEAFAISLRPCIRESYALLSEGVKYIFVSNSDNLGVLTLDTGT